MYLGGSLAFMSNGQQAALSTHRVCAPDALLRAAAAWRPNYAHPCRLERATYRYRSIQKYSRKSKNICISYCLSLFSFWQYLDAERTNADGSIDRRSPVRPPQLMCLGPNFTLHRNSAQQAGVVAIFDRILSELSVKMNRLNIDKAELACLKAIILFNSGTHRLLSLFSNFICFIVVLSRYTWTQKQVGRWYVSWESVRVLRRPLSHRTCCRRGTLCSIAFAITCIEID